LEKITLVFTPNKKKKSAGTTLIPIYLRIIVGQSKAERRLVTACDITNAEFLKWNSVIMRVSERSSKINAYLDQVNKDFIELQRDLLSQKIVVSPKELIQKLFKEEEVVKHKQLIDYVNNYNEKSVQMNTNFSPVTKRNYQKAINHFLRFIVKNYLGEIAFVDFTHGHAEMFKDFLESNEPTLGRKGMTKVSSSSIIKNIKAFFKRGQREGLISKNSFEYVKMSMITPNKKCLTLEHIRKIKDLEINSLSPLSTL